MQTARPDRRSVTILDIPIDDVTEAEALAAIRSFLTQDGLHHICTVNPEFLMEARRNPEFRRVLLEADLRTPDGFGVMLVARWLGVPLRERVTGVELTGRIAELAAGAGYRLFLLGAAPGVAEAAAGVLCQRYPGLMIAGCFAGTPGLRQAPFLCQLIAAAHADILLVAYGHPAQDLWIARNRAALPVKLAIGVGGTFDYLAGRVPRAPGWLRRIGLEWLHRLVHQPWRWRRIVVAVPHFLAAVWLDRRRAA